MGRFLRGFFLGSLFCGAAFVAAAIAVPVEQTRRVNLAIDSSPATPATTPAASTPATAPATVAAVQPSTEPLSLPTPGGGGGGAPSIAAPSLGSPTISSANVGIGGAVDSRPTQTTGGVRVATVTAPSTSQPTVDTATVAAPTVDASLSGETTTGGDPNARVRLTSQPLVAGEALTTNAAPSVVAGNRPRMAIILQDDGAPEQLRQGLLAVSAPITFGVTADLAGATDIAKAYRLNGYEVVAVLPGSGQVFERGGDPDGLRELIGGALHAVPVATALVDRIGGPLPLDDALAQGALDTLSITGHGLLTHRGVGLNNVPDLAARTGVASSIVYRIIDNESTSAAITEELDRAVEEAGQTGQVIVMGRMQPATVTTLFSWLLGPTAKEVSISSVSGVLTN